MQQTSAGNHQASALSFCCMWTSTNLALHATRLLACSHLAEDELELVEKIVACPIIDASDDHGINAAFNKYLVQKVWIGSASRSNACEQPAQAQSQVDRWYEHTAKRVTVSGRARTGTPPEVPDSSRSSDIVTDNMR